MLQLSFLIIVSAFSPDPKESGWDLLSSVEIVRAYDEFMGTEIERPVFPDQLKEAEGKSIDLEGYMIPLEQERKQDYFVLSRFPFQSCFFCGGAGPETVVEVFLEEEFTFMEDRIKVTGILELNEDDPLQLFYVLRNSTITKI